MYLCHLVFEISYPPPHPLPPISSSVIVATTPATRPPVQVLVRRAAQGTLPAAVRGPLRRAPRTRGRRALRARVARYVMGLLRLKRARRAPIAPLLAASLAETTKNIRLPGPVHVRHAQQGLTQLEVAVPVRVLHASHVRQERIVMDLASPKCARRASSRVEAQPRVFRAATTGRSAEPAPTGASSAAQEASRRGARPPRDSRAPNAPQAVRAMGRARGRLSAVLEHTRPRAAPRALPAAWITRIPPPDKVHA